MFFYYLTYGTPEKIFELIFKYIATPVYVWIRDSLFQIKKVTVPNAES